MPTLIDKGQGRGCKDVGDGVLPKSVFRGLG